MLLLLYIQVVNFPTFWNLKRAVGPTPTEIATLGRGHWLGQVPAPFQERILAGSDVRSYEQGEFLNREGEPGAAMYAAPRGGTLDLRSVVDGEDALLRVGEAGLGFGEYQLLSSGKPAIGTVVADTAVRALVLSVRAFERIVDEEPRDPRAFRELLRGLVEAGCRKIRVLATPKRSVARCVESRA